MSPKSLVGLLVLCVLPLVAFRNFRKVKKSRAEMMHNPFALIQKNGAKWLGLESVGHDGFLRFKNQFFGVRAGYLNLIQNYYLLGVDTLNRIFLKYSPPVGDNDPWKYAEIASREIKISVNEKLSLHNYFELGFVIVRIEAGYNYVPREIMLLGWAAAKKQYGV